MSPPVRSRRTSSREVPTPHGPARVHVRAASEPRGALVLGHGAGGSVSAPDLVAVAGAALAAGVTVVLVEQPYRVAGRRSAAPAHQLDAAWEAVVAALRRRTLRGLPLITGGRSSGARVACRTAGRTAAVGVLCLAFPLHPPRRSADAPVKTRQEELDLVSVPVLVVQGERDPFGMPPASATRVVVRVAGDHRLVADLGAVASAVGAWLPTILG